MKQNGLSSGQSLLMVLVGGACSLAVRLFVPAIYADIASIIGAVAGCVFAFLIFQKLNSK